MTSEELFESLKSLAGEMGIKIRFETGNFEGGYCLLREEKMLVINRRVTITRKTRTLALGLHEFGLENVFLSPALREAIEDEVAKAKQESRITA
jgi:hypothetical protein